MPWEASTGRWRSPTASVARFGRSVPRMTLHCAATLLLVPAGHPVDDVGGVGAVRVGALPGGVDVVGELQALADRHRGERVVVGVEAAQLAAVWAHLGRRAPAEAGRETVRLDIGDDGWAVLPVE